ncbi:MAG: ATP-binding cassette domain-containing protein [Gammaproteobacteria bacterium]|nr:ATP-binding cassette domain-containing protein [Gammaproteobacteria bacterium]
MSRICLETVHYTHGTRDILRGISLEIPHASRVTIVGPSGSGKTTLLRIIAGLERPWHGRVFIGQRLVCADGLNLVDPSRRGIAMVFQDLALWPHFTVRENIEFGLRRRGLTRLQRAVRIDDILQRMQLERYASVFPTLLSGGEQQRVAIARALVLHPAVLLMDEPFSNVDKVLREHLIRQITEFQREYDFTLAMVTHDDSDAVRFEARVIGLADGVMIPA